MSGPRWRMAGPEPKGPAMRRPTLVLGVAVLTLGALAPAARADVAVSPGEAVQGDAVNLTFDVREDQPGAYTTKVELVLPEDAPVAEVDPLSVPDWAPKVTYAQAHQPAPAPTPSTQAHGHGAGGMTTASVTWYRVTKPSSPTAASQLRVSMGPLPKVDRLAFTVIQTYSDGRVRVIPPGSGPVLTLRPAATAPDAGSAQHHGTVAIRPAANGSSAWPLALGLVGGATGGVLIALVALGRRRRAPAEEAPLDEVLDAEPDRDRTTSDA